MQDADGQNLGQGVSQFYLFPLFQLAGSLAMISNAKQANASKGGWKALNEPLEKFSHWVTAWSGSSWAFTSALGIILIWAACGPFFHYSDTWQLVINTGTTIVTFLMVFLIQRSQNKDAMAIQVKLNELLASQAGASNQLINVEDWREADLVALHKRFTTLSEQLSQAATDCEAHSIAEAKEAVEDAEEAIGDVRELVEEGKQSPRRDTQSKSNGHSRND